MHSGKPLLICPYGSPEDPLSQLKIIPQLDYLHAYLSGVGVVSVITEQNYFDRDYLDEFAAFYSKSARGYANICKRLHFFSGQLTEDDVLAAVSGDASATEALQGSYLGFVVLRPLDVSPFGRTVLAWYPNNDEHSDRVTPVMRTYTCNLLGLKLSVEGIPWQQQDRGVSACATIALWSMFHSSAFDAFHSVPTTVEITQNALGSTTGSRAFPSVGLSIQELKEAIFAQRLTPKISMGHPIDISDDDSPPNFIHGFDFAELASILAANIRSGYPVLLIGDYVHAHAEQKHAICCIGFREKEEEDKAEGTFSTMDDKTEVFYIHDDNIGPNVRCELYEENGAAVLKTAPPPYLAPEAVQPSEVVKFRPELAIIAVHEEIRMDAQSLAGLGYRNANLISILTNQSFEAAERAKPAITYNTQFRDVRNFYSDYLARVIPNNSELLGKVRISIGKDSPPMCLHIGLVSIAMPSNGVIKRLIDIIYDTTDSAMHHPVIAHIVYDSELKNLLDQVAHSHPQEFLETFGAQVVAF